MIESGAGVDTIVDGSGDSTIKSSSGKDTITSGAGDDVIYAGSEDDTIRLTGTGKHNVRAGQGDDTIEITPALLTFEDTILGDSGSDTLAIDAYVATPINAAFDVNFTNVSGIKTFDFAEDLAASATPSVVLGLKAELTGVDTIAVTSAATGGADATATISAAAFTNALTFNGSEQLTVNDAFTGGAGNDTFNAGAAGDTQSQEVKV